MKQEIKDVARIGILTGGEYSVYVKTDDEQHIPHVHIWDNDTNGMKFDCAITLADYYYLPHGHCTDTISAELLCEYSDFMHQPCRNPHYQSNWEFAMEMWRDNNEDSG